MLPTTRKVARLLGEIKSIARRLNNLIPDFQRLESDSQALFRSQQYKVKNDSEVRDDSEG